MLKFNQLKLNSKTNTMKKEIYNKLVNAIMARPDLYSTHKITYKEGLEVHTFGHSRNTDLAEAKALFKEKGYKGDDVYNDANILSINGRLANSYLTILYGKEKDKISISIFDMGYTYAGRKHRYYPLKRNTPIFAWTKHMYNLGPQRGTKKPLPRIQLGAINLYGAFPQIDDIITKILLGVDYIPKARVSYRHLMNTKDDFQGLGNLFGIKIPEAIKQFAVEDVQMLYKCMKDYNQINKLCQFISKGSTAFTKAVDHHPYTFGIDSYKLNLFQTIALMLFGNYNDEWLIRDAIADNLVLKLKDISLKVHSRKRWLDEHHKHSQARILKGIPEIKADDIYKPALAGLEHPYELIDSKDRLAQESAEQHHCVATYASKINSGQCGIFSVEYEGARWTLEVKAHKYDDGIVYTPVQFRGLCNASAPEALGKRVSDVLYKNSAVAATEAIIERVMMGPMDVLDF